MRITLTGLALLEDRYEKAMMRWESAHIESGGRMNITERHMSRLAYSAYHKYMTAKQDEMEGRDSE